MGAQLVTVAAFADPFEIDRARELLEVAGIRVTVVDREIGPETASVFRPATLHVAREEEARAREVLATFERSRPHASEALRAMVASTLLLPPLQLYSMWLLARLVPHWHQLSSCDRRRMGYALVANLLMFIAAAACVAYWIV